MLIPLFLGIKRYVQLIFLNIAYPVLELVRISGDRDNMKENKTWKRFERQLYSPISFFFADMSNYIVMALLIFAVTLQTAGGTSQRIPRDLVAQFREGNITLTDPRIKKHPDWEGIGMVELNLHPMSRLCWVLFACLIVRFLVEVSQLSNRVPVTRCFLCGDGFCECRGRKRGGSLWWDKCKLYIGSNMNKIDVLLIGPVAQMVRAPIM